MPSNDPPHLNIGVPAGDKNEAPSALVDTLQNSQQPSQDTTVTSAQSVEATSVSAQIENTKRDDSVVNTTAPGKSGDTMPVNTIEQSTTNDSPSKYVPPAKTALESTETHEPTFDTSDPLAKEVENSGPSLTITLLLTTGSRHPFKIDGMYLRKRDVNVENYDPFAMSVYTLKELIWKEWRQDWESRPTSPSFIRLISFGKLLEDKSPLSDCKFNKDAPNVVHMTVKPQEIVDEEDTKGVKAPYSREREASERSPGCRCIIQ